MGYYFIMTGQSEKSGIQVSVFPVPNDGAFRVTITGIIHEVITIKVVNALDVVVKEAMSNEQLRNDRWEHVIDLRPVAPGIYILLIRSGGERWVKKVVVNR